MLLVEIPRKNKSIIKNLGYLTFVEIRKYLEKKNKKRINERNRNYYQRNKERLRELNKRWRIRKKLSNR